MSPDGMFEIRIAGTVIPSGLRGFRWKKEKEMKWLFTANFLFIFFEGQRKQAESFKVAILRVDDPPE